MRAPAYAGTRATVYQGDCVEVMAELDEASVDAIVCDPPYELGFMGKEWDSAGVTYRVETWEAAYRVLKPGGHLVAFGGTRTFHRLTCALEDAGFEIRDCLSWLYGSGFPKSLDVSKAIDKAAGAARKVVGERAGSAHAGMNGIGQGGYRQAGESFPVYGAPATDAAKAWQGWGTALKPAWEPIILARKPLGERNVAANVLAHGTGAINVDGCRVGTDGEEIHAPQSDPAKRRGTVGTHLFGKADREAFQAAQRASAERTATLGRWPANLVLDEAAAGMLDEQSGETESPMSRPRTPDGPARATWSLGRSGGIQVGHGDSGGASRFFYTAKADADDRDGSKHPTVKPVDLMKWLIRLVTPPEGVVLDPFLGSGTTVYAAQESGFRGIGIEREPEYVADAIRRLRQDVLL